MVSWNQVYPAKAYVLVQSGSLSAKYVMTGASNTNKVFSGMRDGTYTYRVKACADQYESLCSNYSVSDSITVMQIPSIPGAFTLPANPVAGSYNVSWGSSLGQVAYYQWRKNKNGVCDSGWTNNNTNTMAAFSGQSDGQYYCEVQARNASGCSSSQASSMITVLNSPGNVDRVDVPVGLIVGQHARFLMPTRPKSFIVIK